MPYQIEVCIDNLESLRNAIAGGATRIELCSSLALGGLTPSYGFMKRAALISTVPIYAMIRPRQGDFLYDNDDVEAMLEDIYVAKKAGLQGVVFGALNSAGDIDMETSRLLVKASSGLGVTFHRAIDQCSDYRLAIENIAELGCERILTSGLSANAVEGKEIISSMIDRSKGRFSVMAGAGVTATNVADIVKSTGVRELHLSGKSTRMTKMALFSDNAKMGADGLDDFKIPVTDAKQIQALVIALKSV
ncbi:copper homeostasis protein CutC [Vibrio algarum]|uniref:PF03932 family protein CutC n=1 Tax=Vibrio algarum TaxID=3020714 RepID=A0ABT4YT82_9VIBR|nr:copper homeostasis protein CutC [Vibrio sp. KJ40-1]MDB1124763.1 copper homeostasis protein CutC [Vibrio sp. KJ40-1]